LAQKSAQNFHPSYWVRAKKTPQVPFFLEKTSPAARVMGLIGASFALVKPLFEGFFKNL